MVIFHNMKINAQMLSRLSLISFWRLDHIHIWFIKINEKTHIDISSETNTFGYNTGSDIRCVQHGMLLLHVFSKVQISYSTLNAISTYISVITLLRKMVHGNSLGNGKERQTQNSLFPLVIMLISRLEGLTGTFMIQCVESEKCKGKK